MSDPMNPPPGYGPPPGGGYGGPPPGGGYGGGYGGQPMGSPPPNNLVWGILTTILCCLPLGIVSIVFAAQVNGKWAAGDVAGAQNSSTKAKQFAIAAAVLGLIFGVLIAVSRSGS